ADDEEEIPAIAAPPPPRALPVRPGRFERPAVAAMPRQPNGDVVRIYIGVGRSAGVRPADLVGAIANEARISSRDIGAIDVADRFSLVEVPAAGATAIITALRGATIRGKKPTVRLDRAK
ncbi:MAG: deaD, partial [Candidatus Eremiobacteraeota bacterium]|nr:deaD [Candidatus Eremiobacteraeota bacterium]